MKVNKLWAALLATSFALGATMSPTIAEAQSQTQTQSKKTKKPDATAAVAPAAAKKARGIVVEPAGVKWGMTMKEVGAVIDENLDAEYKPRYQKVSPGVKMKELDAQLAEEKSAFRRSRIDFGKLPVATDSTALKGEYSYLNKESMMTLTRNGEVRHFFFIQDRLWKIIHEVKFGEKSEVGKDFKEAAVKLSQGFGSAGRVTPPNEAKGIYTTVVDWKNAETHVRLLERSDVACAIAYESNDTLGNLNSLRANKPKEEAAIDPAVAAAIRGPDPEPEKPVDPKAAGKKPKK
jgi:hypothetical protein